jgi:transposase-like protein
MRKKQKQRSYSAEFKQEAVRRMAQAKTISGLAEELGIRRGEIQGHETYNPRSEFRESGQRLDQRGKCQFRSRNPETRKAFLRKPGSA